MHGRQIFETNSKSRRQRFKGGIRIFLLFIPLAILIAIVSYLTERMPDLPLVKAQKQVVSFQTQIAKLQAHAKMGEPLATDLLELSGEVTVRIDGVLTPLAS